MTSRPVRPSRPHLRGLAPIVAGTLILGAAAPAKSANLSITSEAGNRLYFSDNLDLLPESAGAVLFSTTNLNTTITAALPTLEFTLDAGWTYNTYAGPGADGKSSALGQDYSLSVKKETKSTDYSASLGFTVQDAQTSELEDTGLTQIDTNRITTSGAIGIDTAINHNNRIAIDGTVRQVDFSTETDDLNPFFNASLAATWTHLVNSRITTDAKSSISLFKPDNGTGSRTITFLNTVGISVKLTKNLDISGSGGLHLVNTRDDMTPASTAVGFSGKLDAELRRKRTRYGVKFSQNVSPSAAGELLTRTGISTSIRHSINDRTDWSVSAGISTQSGVSDGSSTDRTQLTVSSSLNYRLTRHWQAIFGYDFRRKEEGGETASSNGVYVRMTRDSVLLP